MTSKLFTGFEVKDAEKGEVSAVFSTFNVKDKDGDVTLPDAFKSGADVVISAYGHKSWDGVLPVGVGTITATKTEAILTGQFFLDTESGRDTFTAVKRLAEKGLGEWSYGYAPTKYSFGEHEGERVRFLEELDVTEVSPVLMGAGVNTRTLAAKSAGLRFTEEGESVLAALKSFGDRAADVMAMRTEKGKGLGEDSQGLLEGIETELVRLKGLLTPENSDEVDREFLRYIAAQLPA